MTKKEISKENQPIEQQDKTPRRGRPRKTPTIHKVVDEFTERKEEEKLAKRASLKAKKEAAIDSNKLDNQQVAEKQNISKDESRDLASDAKNEKPRTRNTRSKKTQVESEHTETTSEVSQTIVEKAPLEVTSQKRVRQPRTRKTQNINTPEEIQPTQEIQEENSRNSRRTFTKKTRSTSPNFQENTHQNTSVQDEGSVYRSFASAPKNNAHTEEHAQKETVYNLYQGNADDSHKNEARKNFTAPAKRENAHPKKSHEENTAPIFNPANYNYDFDDENSPIQLLPTQFAQDNQRPRGRNTNKNANKRSSYNNQNNQGRNQQRSENNQGKGLQQRRPQKSKSFSEPAFDNSSIIAAITGKNLEQDIYYNEEQAPRPVKNAPYNDHNPQPSFLEGGEEGFSFLNPNGAKQGQKSHGHRKASSFAQSNTLHENAPRPLNSLPSFIETTLEETSPVEAELAEPAVVPKKAKAGRPKRAKTPEVEISKNIEYLYEPIKTEQHHHSEQLKMFVSVQPDEQVEVVLTENGTVVEYFVEMAHHAKMRGNIYKATIHNVEPNLQAAFINFGAEKNGFLQIDEVHPDYYLNSHVPTKNHRFPLVSKVLKPGQELLVQIVKEPNGNKGAFLTTWISLAGRFLVLTPGQEQLGVSRKVTDPVERERLRSMLDGLNPGKDMGVIIRTAAANASTEELQADLDYLQRLWVDLVHKAQSAPSISLIHQEVELTQRVVRDYLNEDVREIWTDDKNMADAVQDMATLMFPQKKNFVKYYSEVRQSLLERFNLQKQIDEITAREIVLPSGGRVTFDQTEALMAIDINSGKTQGKANFQAMVLQTNIEAAKAIARHLRLRDIGGQVVIDFIELRDKSTIKEVENIFKNSMRPDRARYEIGHISSFGLLELVRQRIGSSAISISTEPCPHCNGTGLRRNMEWQAQDALKEIARKARSEKSIKFVFTTDKELALYLLNHKRDRITEIESKLNLRVEINCH